MQRGPPQQPGSASHRGEVFATQADLAVSKLNDSFKPDEVRRLCFSRALLGGTASSRLVASRHSSERNIDAIGAIDGNNRESEVYQFVLAEVRSSKGKHIVWDIAIGQ